MTDRPAFSALARQHSRSSSQLATLASLTLSPTSPHKRLSSSASSSVGSSRNVSPSRYNPTRAARAFSLGLGIDSGGAGAGGDSDELEPPSPRGRNYSLSSSPRRGLSPIPSSSLEPVVPSAPTEGASPLAQLIQQKRRQASAPYFASARTASLFSPGAGFGIVGSSEEEGRRSRQPSRRGSVGGLQVDLRGTGFAGSADLGMVMTPTTEEWRQLGGQLSELADIRARDEARLVLEGTTSGRSSTVSSSSSSSSISLTAPTFPRRSSHVHDVEPDLEAPPLEPRPVKTSFSYQTSRTGFQTHGTNFSISSLSSSPGAGPHSPERARPSPHTAPLPSSAAFKPSHRAQVSDSGIRPNLSRGSLSSTTGTPESLSRVVPFFDDKTLEDEHEHEHEHEHARPPSPVKLSWDSSLGPVDPRKYSAVSGLRTINDFVIEGEAGTGAYGTVRKAREKGPDGLAVGPSLIIKYVIKQRILADCWKKHKILGPIPIEVHVLDHLRRVPYVVRPVGRRRKLGVAQRRDSAPSVKEGTVTGHPNICGMLDFFEDGEFYYLVMPQAGADPLQPHLPGGQDLFDYVDLHPDGLSPPAIRHILAQIADALFFLHEHGIVHRDIKDENIVLDHRGDVQLIDFGSAAYVKDGKKFDTFSGTLDFAAPEVLKGQRYGGRETDIWALGVLGYVLICGECPFYQPHEAIEGLHSSSRAALALEAKIPSTAPAPLLPPDFHNPLAELMEAASMSDAVDVIMRCLEVDPADRPSADDVLDHAFFLGGGWTGFRGWEERGEVD